MIYPGTSDWRIAMQPQGADPRGHSTVATWHMENGAPVVRQVQSADEAMALFKKYGKEPRY